ncbi:hypothetical protein ACLKA6_016283 [Drosophila palustris]
MDFIRPRNGNAALDKVIPFRDQPLDLTTGYRHLYPNAKPDRPTVAAIAVTTTTPSAAGPKTSSLTFKERRKTFTGAQRD